MTPRKVSLGCHCGRPSHGTLRRIRVVYRSYPRAILKAASPRPLLPSRAMQTITHVLFDMDGLILVCSLCLALCISPFTTAAALVLCLPFSQHSYFRASRPHHYRFAKSAGYPPPTASTKSTTLIPVFAGHREVLYCCAAEHCPAVWEGVHLGSKG